MNTSTPRSLQLVILFLFCLSETAFPQIIRGWQTNYEPDNSYYDIAQVGPNEYWAAGEGGTLYSIDSSGNITEIPFPDKKFNILKILSTDGAIYLAGDQGKIFRYERTEKDFQTQYYGKKYDQLCFYDMMEMEDGTLLVVGGHNKIAKGEKALPMGFIAHISPDLSGKPQIVWSNPFTFVWSVIQMPGSDEIVAASFNGLNTHLLSSVDFGQSFQKSNKINGLVHHLQTWNDELWYSGTKSIRFSRKGIIGKVDGPKQQVIEGGCVWSLLPIKDQLLGLNYSGELIFTETEATHTSTVKATEYSLYEGIELSPEKALVIGHGRRLFLIDMEDVGPTYIPSEDLSQAGE